MSLHRGPCDRHGGTGTPRIIRRLVPSACVLVSCILGMGCESKTAPTVALSERPAPAVEWVRPEPRPAGFVGSAVCRDCHADIARRYAEHPMGRSAAGLDQAPRIESFTEPPVISTGGFHYQARPTDDGQAHHETLMDADGKALYDQTVKMEYVIGSGRRGRSYLAAHGNYLVMSPLTWYSQRGRWDLSPGYDRSLRHFERRAVDGCLQCHTGRVASGAQPDSVLDPAFHETAIGCERCHGPAEAHVRWRLAHPSTAVSAEDPIVNPGRLPPDRREAVCHQCHLQGSERVLRYGRHESDFRPGDALTDVWILFAQRQSDDGSGETAAVHQVPQMRASRCFQASEGRLGCISCHDPHGVPAVETRVEHFRRGCLNCHATAGCGLEDSVRRMRQPDDSCIACHMPRLSTSDVPHTSQTDHRILRDPSVVTPRQPTDDNERFELAESSDDPSFVHELPRARGLLMARYARDLKDRLLAAAAMEQLQEITAADDDLDYWRSLGDLYALLNHPDMAEQSWRRVLQTSPEDELALRGLGIVCHEAGRLTEAAEFFERCLRTHPWDRQSAGRRVHVLGQLGRLPEARELAEPTLERYPWDVNLRTWWMNDLKSRGRLEEAAEQQAILVRLRRTEP